MLDLSRKLTDELVLDEDVYPMNISFNKVLKVIELINDDDIEELYKPYLAIQIFTDVDFTQALTPEQATAIFKMIFEGDYIKEDAAQAIIAAMEFKTGDDRNVWFKVVESDGKTQYVGVATASGIKIGGGEASEYEGFEVTISWNTSPKQSAVVGG